MPPAAAPTFFAALLLYLLNLFELALQSLDPSLQRLNPIGADILQQRTERIVMRMCITSQVLVSNVSQVSLIEADTWQGKAQQPESTNAAIISISLYHCHTEVCQYLQCLHARQGIEHRKQTTRHSIIAPCALRVNKLLFPYRSR